jgi:hypothetical protein
VRSGGTFSCRWPTCSTPLFSSLYRTDLHDLPGDTMRSFALDLVLFLKISLTLASPSCRQSTIILHAKTKCKRNFQLFLDKLFGPFALADQSLSPCRSDRPWADGQAIDNRTHGPTSSRLCITPRPPASPALNRKIPQALPLECGRGAGNDMRAWLQYNPFSV